MKYSVVLQSFGREQEYKRAIFCLLSHLAYAQPDSFDKVILFTDNPDYFKPYLTDAPVQYVLLTEEKMKSMRGAIDFLHRMKIAMIEEAFNSTDGNLLYIDSDTFFIGTPQLAMDQLSPDLAFMHKHEYQFNTLKDMPLPAGAPFRAFYELIVSNKFKLPDDSNFLIPPEFSSWNAGAMAFFKSQSMLLADVYALTDQFYPSTHNHASEQYAFSVVLQNQLTIKPLDEVIYHYWYRTKKVIMDECLAKEIDNTFQSLSAQQKKDRIVLLTKKLPFFLENHTLTLRDNSIQAFHENKFRAGFHFALLALLKDPFNGKFFMDLGYHIRRWIKNSLV